MTSIFSLITLSLIISVCVVCVCVCTCKCATVCMWKSEQCSGAGPLLPPCWSRFSLSTLWVTGNKLKQSGLAATAFTYWATSPFLCWIFYLIHCIFNSEHFCFSLKIFISGLGCIWTWIGIPNNGRKRGDYEAWPCNSVTPELGSWGRGLLKTGRLRFNDRPCFMEPRKRVMKDSSVFPICAHRHMQ